MINYRISITKSFESNLYSTFVVFLNQHENTTNHTVDPKIQGLKIKHI